MSYFKIPNDFSLLILRTLIQTGRLACFVRRVWHGSMRIAGQAARKSYLLDTSRVV